MTKVENMTQQLPFYRPKNWFSYNLTSFTGIGHYECKAEPNHMEAYFSRLCAENCIAMYDNSNVIIFCFNNSNLKTVQIACPLIP